ncbi:hypothetical protein TCAL_15478 [Tigriopus californicus]|uniref:Uncharacterized protein n=1 Tax=Tigriopus californicus TaxID=6832 RepID=A0A553PRM0_TIGCA|nr:hypothetical protein TCAL_15478 [Tigriopus californicus]
MNYKEEQIAFDVIDSGKVYINSKRGLLEDETFSGNLDQIRFSTYPITYARNDDALCIGKAFPWTDLILNDMLRMSGGGIFDHYFYEDISPERMQLLEPRNIPESSYVNAAISLEQIMFIFLLWMGGLVLSGFAFLLECVQFRQSSKDKRNMLITIGTPPM